MVAMVTEYYPLLPALLPSPLPPPPRSVVMLLDNYNHVNSLLIVESGFTSTAVFVACKSLQFTELSLYSATSETTENYVNTPKV